ncbi:MAG: hypothetical protein M1825_004459 [Sarcosagium campestre]|nr:MAG: hypothetical protein M1825_004459 [Sarcosagium campestre]
MSDSVDRVFVHALNTVKKIPRTGSARPPPSDRLRLYGLYKQSMEGDVETVMRRPKGDGEDMTAERQKWDAWNAQKGLSKTEAKRRYIGTLIDTMHKYASTTPDARELVSELEFVWEQIKSNAATSASAASSPPGAMADNEELASKPSILSRQIPLPKPDDDENDDDDDDDDRPASVSTAEIDLSLDPLTRDAVLQDRKTRQSRIGRTLAHLAVEVAAIRRQLERTTPRYLSRRGARRRGGWLAVWEWVSWVVATAVRHLLVDALLFAVLAIIWARRRRRRLLLSDLRGSKSREEVGGVRAMLVGLTSAWKEGNR